MGDFALHFYVKIVIIIKLITILSKCFCKCASVRTDTAKCSAQSFVIVQLAVNHAKIIARREKATP